MIDKTITFYEKLIISNILNDEHKFEFKVGDIFGNKHISEDHLLIVTGIHDSHICLREKNGLSQYIINIFSFVDYFNFKDYNVKNYKVQLIQFKEINL